MRLILAIPCCVLVLLWVLVIVPFLPCDLDDQPE
jgi:hypothetical protein